MADNYGNGGVSAQTDELGSTLMGEALDRLAAGEDFSVVATAADSQGQPATWAPRPWASWGTCSSPTCSRRRA